MQPNNPRQNRSWKILYTRDFLIIISFGILVTAILAGLISQEIYKAKLANIRDELDDMKRYFGIDKESQQNQEINHGNKTCLTHNSTYEQ